VRALGVGYVTRVLIQVDPGVVAEVKRCSDELKETHRWIRAIEEEVRLVVAPLQERRDQLVLKHNEFAALLRQLRTDLRREHDAVEERAEERGDGEALDALLEFWDAWDELDLGELDLYDDWSLLEGVDLPDELPRELDLLPTRCEVT
jgi:hypothetical protein